jgi:glucose-fructose oxidoreductase
MRAVDVPHVCVRAQTETLRVAVVGLTHGHVEGFLQDLPRHNRWNLWELWKKIHRSLNNMRRNTSSRRIFFFSQLGRMIEERHLQVVVVYTSTREHRRVIEEAARHGVSAMVEKPLTISLDDALAIQKVTQQQHTPRFW